jgi:hypothetical protein
MNEEQVCSLDEVQRNPGALCRYLTLASALLQPGYVTVCRVVHE